MKKSNTSLPRTPGGKALHARRLRQRTHQPVRRGSFHHDAVIEGRWASSNRFPRSENNARMRAAEAYEHFSKPAGRRNGKLGHIALEVYRFMLRLRGKADGRLDPSYSWIAAQIRRSRSAVAKAIARLKAEGFLDWTRRTRPVVDPEPGGQYVEQIANAYYLKLPAIAASLVARVTRAATEATQRALTLAERASRADRAARTSPTALAAASAPKEQLTLREAILSLGRTVDRCEAEAERASPPKGRKGAL
ncbi:hypothetical protein [Sphingomonas sp. VNH70]|uniref:hypothetical protein n=1 Tax=Sphingomonas silueang TaxID=3156617 RepID=UPI0032B3B55D